MVKNNKGSLGLGNGEVGKLGLVDALESGMD